MTQANGAAAVTQGAVNTPRPPPDPYFNREVLADWVRDKSHPKQGKNFQCVLFTLEHNHPDQGWGVITPARVPRTCEGDEREKYIAKLVEEFEYGASAATNALTKPQLFRVGGHITEKDSPSEFVMLFTMKPIPGLAGSLESEVNQGQFEAVLGHISRLLDTTTRQNGQNMQACMDRIFESERDMRRSYETLFLQRMEAAERTEKLLDGKSLRDVTEYEKRRNIDLQNDMIKALITYAGPVVGALAGKAAGKLAGVEIGVAAVDPLLDFAKTLSPKQLLSFIDELTDEQKQKFLPMAGKLADSMQDEQKKELQILMVQKASEKSQEGGEK